MCGGWYDVSAVAQGDAARWFGGGWHSVRVGWVVARVVGAWELCEKDALDARIRCTPQPNQ